ncbi:Calcium-binding component of the spindle pole body (SPB) half-bridge [Cadophora gregata]|uniref:Calcium-binding component of the spindle pole body (SPB) half-bridge n=1 Tax=Cadophora gregata TaxID=51156 RepID=UPI0026DCEC66|nr:Calcium-binding component of the spindle pole body (SPB) half-bridge [Cadophora gregata]KAK0124254.1 Calcium-binding component of the spindle pole body (SPB) half-bridge [Cadophora gregata]KAK0129894.1 Calcium-binding component of the spindle pole body (SPB) half-bridge [Cadophora gregata f. sp. sojae]
MASTAHPSFPQRPYSSTLHGKLPERNVNAFGGSAHPAGRDAGRGDRERGQQQQRESKEPETPQVSDEQREEINEAFALFDLDKDHRIDYHEFKVALKALGFDLPKSEILAHLSTYGVPPLTPSNPPPQSSRPQNAFAAPHQSAAASNPLNPNEPLPPGRLTLTLPSFQTIAAKLISERDPRDEILRAFALFDADEKGMITLEDLRRVARELGEGLEDEELVAMIEEFDLEGKGGVGRDEFVGICMS